MAAYAACKRLGQFGCNSNVGFIRFGALDYYCPSAELKVRFSTSSGPILRYWHLDRRQISDLVKSNGKRLFLVDTLALVRGLEAQGVPSKQAEAITAAITNVLNDTLENLSHSFVGKAEMEKVEMVQEAKLSKFKSEIQSSQGHHFSLLQHETEKLRGDIEKMHSELRRIREDLANQSAETTNLNNKVDREIHALKAQLEAAKYDVIKYCIGSLVSISAVGLAVVRILM